MQYSTREQETITAARTTSVTYHHSSSCCLVHAIRTNASSQTMVKEKEHTTAQHSTATHNVRLRGNKNTSFFLFYSMHAHIVRIDLKRHVFNCTHREVLFYDVITAVKIHMSFCSLFGALFGSFVSFSCIQPGALCGCMVEGAAYISAASIGVRSFKARSPSS